MKLFQLRQRFSLLISPKFSAWSHFRPFSTRSKPQSKPMTEFLHHLKAGDLDKVLKVQLIGKNEPAPGIKFFQFDIRGLDFHFKPGQWCDFYVPASKLHERIK